MVAEEYHRNVYGESTSVLHRGTPTDRLVAQWWIRTPHVARRVAPEPALAATTRALATWQELGEVALEAEALDRLARYYHGRREYRQGAQRYGEAADAFATFAAPIEPPPPATFSTTMVRDTRSPSFCATSLLTTSVAPPAAKGTISEIGLVG